MNVVARRQLMFQMLTLLQKYIKRQTQYSKTWDNKYLAHMARMVTTFSINPKAGFEFPSGPDIFYLKNFDIFFKTSVHESKMIPAHSLHFKC